MVDSPSLWKMVPSIKRARDFRLYDFRGNRYLDLYLNNGRCLLGHRPEGVFGVMKNTLSKGLAAEYPSCEMKRYVKLLSGLFPEYREFRVYRSFERALGAVRETLGDRELTIRDPLLEDPGPAMWWRPFAPAAGSPEVLLPIIPFPSLGAPVTVCFKNAGPADSDFAPPYLIAGLCRTTGTLRSFDRFYTEETWKRFDVPGLWERRGPYLLFLSTEESYRRLFEVLLAQGVLLPPHFPAVGIVPGNFTDGEIAPIIKAAKEQGV